MIIKKDIKEVEQGINEIISTIAFYKDVENKDVENIDINSIGAVEGNLKNLEKIEVLEDVLRLFHINSYEYEGNTVNVIYN